MDKEEMCMEAMYRVEREEATLIVIDPQETLVKAVDEEMGRNFTRNVPILVTFARDMDIPVMVTQQYPKGLGGMIPEIEKVLGGISPIDKVTFSCCRVGDFNEKLSQLRRRQIILCGIEAHVCVLQTAADLIFRGYDIHVVADAVCSRRKLDWDIGLRWMEKKGATISTTEIIAFQLLKEAGTEEFKQLSRILR
jgi:nicotinamidase-related amidase